MAAKKIVKSDKEAIKITEKRYKKEEFATRLQAGVGRREEEERKNTSHRQKIFPPAAMTDWWDHRTFPASYVRSSDRTRLLSDGFAVMDVSLVFTHLETINTYKHIHANGFHSEDVNTLLFWGNVSGPWKSSQLYL